MGNEKHIIKKIIAYNEKEKLFQKGDKILVGLSGGADSVCLLYSLWKISKEWNLSLHAIHIHHGLRGEEADKDAFFSEQTARQWGVPFSLVRTDIRKLSKENGWSEEEAGRRFRYATFEQYREQLKADKIAVAHHEDDQAETVLFHLFRGTGPRGLAGIPAKRGCIIRPLLGISRAEIESCLQEEKIAYATDKTNFSDIYSRNKLRLTLLPWVKEELNSQAAKHVASAAQKVAKWRDYIEEQGAVACEKVCEEKEGGVRIHIPSFLSLEEVVRDEVLRQIFEKILPGARDIGQVHYAQIMALTTSKTGHLAEFPGGVRAVREYEYLCFLKREEDIFFERKKEIIIPPCTHILQKNGKKIPLHFEVKKREELPGEIPQKDYTKWLDYDMIRSNLVLRNPQEGDYLILNDQGHKKKLSRYYIDRKVPLNERAGQMVLADENHVVWALPDRISALCKVSENTKNVLVITKERDLP